MSIFVSSQIKVLIAIILHLEFKGLETFHTYLSTRYSYKSIQSF